MVTAVQASTYLVEYIRRYRAEYQRFTTPPPRGGGYPLLSISPYLEPGKIQCHLARDGAVIVDHSHEPDYRWEIAGGPAMMADFPESRTPAWVTKILESEGILGKDIGIHRVVSQTGIPDHIWRGDLGRPIESSRAAVDELELEVVRHKFDWRELIRRLTFGALDLIIDMRLPANSDEFWTPRTIRDIGFIPADRTSKRFIHYAEFLPHVDRAAWDPRSAWARAHVDLRRDFAHAITASEPGGYMSFLAPEPPIGPRLNDRLDALTKATDGLIALLDGSPSAPESTFHEYLLENPILLDVYGDVESKPRLHYPPGESPTGKTYVEPDFIIRYPNQTYKLVEIERPDHRIATSVGHPRAAVNHAAFQFAEWKDYLLRHYNLVKSQYPGISTGLNGMIVIGRDTERSFGTASSKEQYISMLRQMYSVEDVFTFDDLVQRARGAISRLASLGDSLASYPR
jgi:hypothetical protein